MKAQLKLTKEQIAQAENAYAGRPDEKNGKVLFEVTGTFPNGFQMDIQIPNCRDVESNSGENYIQNVLFDEEGCELSSECGDVGEILGEYFCYYGNEEYVLEVVGE